MSSPQDIRDMDLPALTAKAAREGWSLRITATKGHWECAVYSQYAERLATGKGEDMLDAIHSALSFLTAWEVTRS